MRSSRPQLSEQLDRALSVTSAKEWVALLAILAVAVAVVVWSVVGEVATYVEARGLLLSRGGNVVDAVAAGPGRLSMISVAVGDEIEENAVVALIINEEISARSASARVLVEERSRALGDIEAVVAEESAIVRANNARRRNQLDELVATAVEMVRLKQARLDNHRQFLEEGLVARVELERTQQEFNEARRVLLDLARDRDALEANEIRFTHENSTRIREARSELEVAQFQARETDALVAASSVVAPVSGEVIEIKVAHGAMVGPGTAVVSIRSGPTNLELLFYVPPDASDQVEVGMQAHVVPVTVRREEFGAIRGTVASLSSFPASIEGAVAVLQNRNLAESFFKDGPPYAGRIALVPDPTTASGFSWTSSKAAGQTVGAGTLASVEIKTRSQPPITLAIPLLKDLLGLT